jgi:hypothetical protein
MQVSTINQTHRNTFKNTRKNQPTFQEIPGGAFFLGKLNKNHNREQIYTALRSLASRCNFYIRKLDMPYGNKYTKEGNLGYCFVHCKSKEEADRIVAMHYVKLGTQRCEVKAYGGRDIGSTPSSQATSGYVTPASDSVLKHEPFVTKDLAKILHQKLSVKAQSICSWAEECDDPLSYYADCTDGVFNEVEVDSLLDENIAESEQLTKFTPDSVNSYIQQNLITASTYGKAPEFLQAYFEIYGELEKKIQTMSKQELNEIASQYSSLLTSNL